MGTSCSRSVLADVSASFGEQEGSISPSRLKAGGEALFATSKAGSTSTEGSTHHASTHLTRKGFATPTCIRNYDEEQRRKHLSESPRETAPDDLGGGTTATKSDNLSEKGIDTSDQRKGCTEPLQTSIHNAAISHLVGTNSKARQLLVRLSREDSEPPNAPREDNLARHDLPHNGVEEDARPCTRFLIAAALNIFSRDRDPGSSGSMASSLRSPLASEPFVLADLALGQKIGTEPFGGGDKKAVGDGAHAAVMDAIAMLHVVSDGFRLRQSCIMNALSMLDRAADAGIRCDHSTYRSLLLTALLISVKECKESSVWIKDMRMLFPSLNLTCLSHLEPLMLSALDYRVSLLSSGAERDLVASRLEKLRATEETLQPSSRAGFVLCRTLISWSRNYLRDVLNVQ